MEEVGIDISDCDFIISHHEPSVTGDRSTVWGVVFMESEIPPTVPTSELGKVVKPTWIPFHEVDVSLMAEETRASYLASAKYFYRGLSSSVAGVAESKWLRRDTGKLPAGFDLLFINNKDRLCPAYTIAAVTGQTLDYAALDAKLGPGQSYSIQELVEKPEEWAIWNSDSGTWSVGDPLTARYFAVHSLNGPYGHLDGMRKSADPKRPIDETWYPTGRGSEKYDFTDLPASVIEFADSKVRSTPDGPERQELYLAALGAYTVLDSDDRQAWLQAYKLARSIEARTAAVGSTPTQPAVAAAPDHPPPELDTPVTPEPPLIKRSYAGQVFDRFRGPPLGDSTGHTALASPGDPSLWRAGNLDIISLVSLKRAFAVQFDDRAKLFTTYQPDEAFTYGAPSEGASNLINVLYTGARNRLLTLATSREHGTTITTLRVRTGAEYTYTREISAHINGYGRPRQVVAQNVLPARLPDQYSKVEKDFRGIFYNLIETNTVSNAMVDLMTSTDDRDGTNYVEWYERLFAMAFAAHTGCQPRTAAGGLRPVPGLPANAVAGTSPQWYALFPNAAGVTTMFGVTNAGPANPRPRPVHYPRAQPKNGVSRASILPFRRFTNLVTPPLDPGAAAGPRDWRVALYHCTRPYLDMESPATLTPANAARTDANIRLTSPYLTSYSAKLPVITFLTNEVDAGRAGIYDVQALTNPQSAMDAISFLLQNFGGSADAMTAYSNMLRRTGRYFPAEVTLLPSELETRYTIGARFRRFVRCRLTYLRCIRPQVDAGLGAAVRNDPESVKDIKVWNAVAPAGIDLSRDSAAGANGAAALGVYALVYRFAGFGVVNLPAAHFLPQAPFGGNGNTRIDIAWHNYFANVPITGTRDDPLYDFIETMPPSALENLRLWIDLPFAVGAWHNAGGAAPTAVMLAAPQDWTITISDRRGGAIAQPDKPTAIAHGCEFRSERILPLTNFIENRTTAVPFGARLLRSIRSAQSMYHSDSSALTLADRLIHGDFSTIFDTGILLQLQMRAGVDMICAQLSISPAALALADGRALTGNVQLDREISTTNDYVDMVGLDHLVPGLLTGVGEVIGSIGLPTTWASELASGTTVEVFPHHLWDYRFYGGAPNYEDCNVVYRALSPVTCALFRPELNIPGSVVVDKPKIFSTLSPSSLLPWDEWAINESQFLDTEPFGVMRCVAALSGLIIRVKPGLRRVHTSGNADPYTHDLLTRYGRVGPKVPWQTPTMENSLLDPFWFLGAPLGFLIRAEPHQDVYDFITPGPIHAYQYNARITPLPPVNVMNAESIINLLGRTAQRRPPSAYPSAITGWNADSFVATQRLALAGVYHLGPAYNALQPDNSTTPYGESNIRVNSGQASSNTTWMRSPPALEACNALTRTQFADRTRQIVGPNGNPFGAGWHAVPGASAGMSTTAFGSTIHTVPFSPPIPPAEQLMYLVMQSPTWSMRWRTWYSELKPGALPILLAPLTQYATGLGVPLLTGMPSIGISNRQPIPAQNALNPKMRARMGLPTEQVDTGLVQSFDPFLTNLPITQSDPRHIATGYSAANGSYEQRQSEHSYPARPLLTYDPVVEKARLEAQLAILTAESEALASGRARPILSSLRSLSGF
jgi:hypothetical protein